MSDVRRVNLVYQLDELYEDELVQAQLTDDGDYALVPWEAWEAGRRVIESAEDAVYEEFDSSTLHDIVRAIQEYNRITTP